MLPLGADSGEQLAPSKSQLSSINVEMRVFEQLAKNYLLDIYFPLLA
jgi:hypothetical protein